MSTNNMAAPRNKLVFAFGILIIGSVSTASSLLRDLVGDFDVCEDVCQKTFPPHTYDKSLSEDCCKRGCRLFSIIELVGDQFGVNGTLNACYHNCNDAYPGDTDESSACIAGCNSQKPLSDKFHANQLPGLESSPFFDDGLPKMMYPLMYMHNMYSNMVDKVSQHVSISWSFFMQDGTGRLVVIKSQPQVLGLQDAQDFDDSPSLRGVSSVPAETNIEPMEHTATEMLKYSQLKSFSAFGGEVNFNQNEHWRKTHRGEMSGDWLTCIARKTGIPRLFLCILLLLSALSMIWLGLSAVSPNIKKIQKLSIKSMDMDYLRYLPEKKGIKGIHPQDYMEARPLPVKIKVEQI